jgi:hypothetical protein
VLAPRCGAPQISIAWVTRKQGIRQALSKTTHSEEEESPHTRSSDAGEALSRRREAADMQQQDLRECGGKTALV